MPQWQRTIVEMPVRSHAAVLPDPGWRNSKCQAFFFCLQILTQGVLHKGRRVLLKLFVLWMNWSWLSEVLQLHVPNVNILSLIDLSTRQKLEDRKIREQCDAGKAFTPLTFGRLRSFSGRIQQPNSFLILQQQCWPTVSDSQLEIVKREFECQVTPECI